MATNATVTEETPTGSSSPDWSTSYSQFLSRATAQAAATLGLYQQALTRVSEGKLEPTAFQNEFPRFVQSHGAKYSNRLSEMGSRFLRRLVELSAAYSRQGAGSEFSEPDLLPPRFESENAARWFEQFAEYAGKLNNRAMRAYRSQLDEVASGERTPAEVQHKAVEDLSHKFPQMLQEMTGLYFDLLNGMNEIRAEYEKEYFLSLLALANQPDREPAVILHLTGPRGETAIASLSVANTTGEKSAIRFSFTDARRVDGVGPAFSPEIAINPAVPELSPGEEQTIRLSVRLDAERFDVGATYASTLYINGGDALRVEVHLRILAKEPTHPVTGMHVEG